MNSHRKQKHQLFTRLAQQVTTGCIVELGAYQGEGTIALCKGASVPVYTVDDYRAKNGWAGERYSKNDRAIFLANIQEAQSKYGLGNIPHLIQGDVLAIARTWAYPLVSLLVWDLGMENRLAGDFRAWQEHVTGKFVIHDTDDQRLGSDRLEPDGWRKYKMGVLWVLERL